MKFIELKIKIKSLAAEAKIIRHAELKLKRLQKLDSREKVYLHRVNIVRPEARAAQLAYGFLRGRTYEQLEQNCEKPVPVHYLARLVHKFGGKKVTVALIEAWVGGKRFDLAA